VEGPVRLAAVSEGAPKRHSRFESLRGGRANAIPALWFIWTLRDGSTGIACSKDTKRRMNHLFPSSTKRTLLGVMVILTIVCAGLLVWRHLQTPVPAAEVAAFWIGSLALAGIDFPRCKSDPAKGRSRFTIERCRNCPAAPASLLEARRDGFFCSGSFS